MKKSSKGSNKQTATSSNKYNAKTCSIETFSFTILMVCRLLYFIYELRNVIIIIK